MSTNRYEKGKIYKIVCNITGECYIGSTCESTLARRLARHRKDFKRWKANNHTYTSSFQIIERDNYDIVLIEDFKCETKDQLLKRERHFIENNKCINILVPTRTMQEYRQEFKNKVNEQSRGYYNNNKSKKLEQQKIYRELNKEKIQLKNQLYYQKKKTESNLN
jgi:hypothetical protein